MVTINYKNELFEAATELVEKEMNQMKCANPKKNKQSQLKCWLFNLTHYFVV